MAAIAQLKPASARIDSVLNSLGIWIATSVNAGNITAEVDVMIGKPEPDDVKATLALPDPGGAIVYIETMPGSAPQPAYACFTIYREVYPQFTLALAVNANTVTLSGDVSAGVNIHIMSGFPAVDVYYQTTGNETDLADIANWIVAASDTAGVAATAIGATIAFPPGPIQARIGGNGSLVRESMRISQRFKAIILAPSADNEAAPQLGLRTAIGQAIISTIGTLQNDNLPIDDGTYEIIRYRDNWFVDKSLSDFDIYEYHILFEVSYGILETTVATQVGVMGETLTNFTSGATIDASLS